MLLSIQLFMWLYSSAQHESSIAEKYQSADLIVEAYLDGIFQIKKGEVVSFIIRKNWKGKAYVSSFILRYDLNDTDRMHFYENEDYLLFCKMDSVSGNYITTAEMGTKLLLNAEAEIDYLEANAACIDNESKPQKFPCTRDISFVCGCDGNTYSNICAANEAGIQVWTQGICD
ncbi:Kazal-type serine protease inhibitor family protein [Fulvivirga ligni]|uniref:Kazal-type serine protease inhibitor family protein n=1 Tax=Fulvivirga ligni TaxID=2904246 RepID=UPI001F21D1B5|nr:Kazal-type serine protease inhibitor [Fulvivirga ligni]UII22650.1 Kazal-type serine protease inhibitor [Fulvivirga ligni]